MYGTRHHIAKVSVPQHFLILNPYYWRGSSLICSLRYPASWTCRRRSNSLLMRDHLVFDEESTPVLTKRRAHFWALLVMLHHSFWSRPQLLRSRKVPWSEHQSLSRLRFERSGVRFVTSPWSVADGSVNTIHIGYCVRNQILCGFSQS